MMKQKVQMGQVIAAGLLLIAAALVVLWVVSALL